jgi:hypothetical protein
MKANAQQITAIKDAAEQVGGRYHDDYSGRGMYGATCVSIYTDSLGDAHDAVAKAGITGARMDSMGRGAVVYWPALSVAPTESAQ